MSEGLNLPDVTDLVLYDVPRNRSALQQVFGRFDRLGRIGRLTIHVLVPEDGPDATDFEPVRLLHEIDLEQQE
jgi:superfamily II DNA/RNA helicase